MEYQKIVHLLYVPWTGLGLYGGFRGNRWLRNRIEVFKQFVVPSLCNQTSKDFVLWCSWRPEEKNNTHVKAFLEHMSTILDFRTVHTFHGVCFWDDKYPDEIARTRLLTNLHGSMGEMVNVIGEAEKVLMTIQPSDDCYHQSMVRGTRAIFERVPHIQAFGFRNGYIMDYRTGALAEYNPKTIPPFFTIMFPRETFLDPLKHAEYTGPYKSHEYIATKPHYGSVRERGFLVGTHGENVSTFYNHPYKGKTIEGEERERIAREFGLVHAGKLKISYSMRRRILSQLPHPAQKKLRYLFGEKLWNRLYNFLRS